MSHASPARERDRRAFLKLMASAIAAMPVVVRAQTPPAPGTPGTPPPATGAAAAAAPAAPEHSSNEARLLTEVLRARYPDRFTETQWQSIASDFDGDLSGSKRLRGMKLANGDEPDSTFRP